MRKLLVLVITLMAVPAAAQPSVPVNASEVAQHVTMHLQHHGGDATVAHCVHVHLPNR